MPRRDNALLLDMLIACRKIMRFTTGLSWEDFEQNELVQSAVIREFQVLGEASRMVTEATQAQHPQVPWAVVRGMRNRLVHEYFDIRLDVIWETIEKDLPVLVSQLEPIVPDENDNGNQNQGLQEGD